MSHGVGLLLLTAIGGYWVCERAETHKGRLKNVGQLLGSVIIIVSLIGVACQVWCLVTGAGGSYPIRGMGKGGYCPYTAKTAPSNVESQEGVR